MIRIQLDQTWRQKLLGLDKTIEFCDESGKVLGQFVPSEDIRREAARRQLLSIPEADLIRIRDKESGRSLDEILRDLEKA